MAVLTDEICQRNSNHKTIKATTKAKNKTTTKAMLVMTTMLTSIAGNLPTTADIKVPIKICVKANS